MTFGEMYTNNQARVDNMPVEKKSILDSYFESRVPMVDGKVDYEKTGQMIADMLFNGGKSSVGPSVSVTDFSSYALQFLLNGMNEEISKDPSPMFGVLKGALRNQQVQGFVGQFLSGLGGFNG